MGKKILTVKFHFNGSNIVSTQNHCELNHILFKDKKKKLIQFFFPISSAAKYGIVGGCSLPSPLLGNFFAGYTMLAMKPQMIAAQGSTMEQPTVMAAKPPSRRL